MYSSLLLLGCVWGERHDLGITFFETSIIWWKGTFPGRRRHFSLGMSFGHPCIRLFSLQIWRATCCPRRYPIPPLRCPVLKGQHTVSNQLGTSVTTLRWLAAVCREVGYAFLSEQSGLPKLWIISGFIASTASCARSWVADAWWEQRRCQGFFTEKMISQWLVLETICLVCLYTAQG